MSISSSEGNEKPDNQKDRNQYGIGFVLSPLARKAWINTYWQSIKYHHTLYGMTRIALINQLLIQTNLVKIFSSYVRPTSQENLHDFVEKLTGVV